MKPSPLCVLVCAAVGVFVAHDACAAPPSFQLSDLARLIGLSSPQVSPDGRQIAVVVSTPDLKSNKSQQEIDVVDVVTGARRSLTWKRTGIDAPHWSPDGRQLAFLAEDPESKQAQLFVLPMDGGDARRLTDVKHGVESYCWSPDGREFAFVTADDAANEQAIKQHDDAFKVTDNNFTTRAALTSWHLWSVASAGGEPKRLTEGDYSLQTDQQDSAPVPSWSHDGRRVAFTRFPNPYWGPSFKSVIGSTSSDGGQVDIVVPDEGAATPVYAPDGNALAFQRPRDGDQNNGNAVYVLEHGGVRDITAALARNINTFAWLPHEKGLLLAGADGTRAVLWDQPLAGTARQLDLGDLDAHPDLSISVNGAIAFIGSTASHADELYVLDAVGAKPRQLTHVNAFMDGLTLGRVQSIEWHGPNGFHEDGVLTYPVGYVSGKTYPLVLVIHGGPEEASTASFSKLPQLLAAQGFLILQPNYRGSTNLGDAYQHAIFRDTGTGPGEDVMAGLAAVERMGIVDTQRIGVSGWSYGGFMTTWLTGHYQVWKAAVSGAALTDWVMDYTVAYYQQGDTYLFGGSPWIAKYHDIWRDQSPITYAQHVTAPTLIMGDVGDPNVPLINSYEWYHALRDNGVEVEFYAYPADTHFPGDIVRTTDVYRRWIDWMKRHLQ